MEGGKGRGGTRTWKALPPQCRLASTDLSAAESPSLALGLGPHSILHSLAPLCRSDGERLKSSLLALGPVAVTWPPAFELASPAMGKPCMEI